MQPPKTAVLSACLVCGKPLSAKDRLVFENSTPLRHQGCSKDTLIRAFRKQAESAGLATQDLLVRRLAELQGQIVRALGQVSFEQFYNAGPQGYVTVRASSRNSDLRVGFSVHLQPDAIYFEPLIAPGELAQQKTHWLDLIAKDGTRRGEVMNAELAKKLLIERLQTGDEHWDGRKKVAISLELLATERVTLIALTWAGMDRELTSAPSEPIASELQRVAQRILSASSDKEVHSECRNATPANMEGTPNA